MAKKNEQPSAEVPTLQEYIAQAEAKAQPLAICQITHPEAIDGTVHEGTYSGIRMVRGDALSALLSDGSTI